MESLGRIVNAYLELAEDRARRKIPMTMEDWSKRLDNFLEFDERDVLQNAGKISAKIAKEQLKVSLKNIVLSRIGFLSLILIKKLKKLQKKKRAMM